MEATPQDGNSAPRGPNQLAAWVVLSAGFVFTLGLQTTIHDEVFISGDGGLKALLVRQFAAGDWHCDLRLKADESIRGLWAEGYYPFEPPFVYPIPRNSQLETRNFIAFPIWFPLLSAPFYALAGFRGLYVLPLICTWVVWIRFHFLCRRLGVSLISESLGLLVLIFASPLTFYSATFWEHAPAAALSFCGLAELVGPAEARRSRGRATLAGACLGFAIWLRPECACLAGAAMIAGLGWVRSRDGSRTWTSCFRALAAVLVLLAIANVLIYGRMLGVHAHEALDRLRSPESLSTTWALFRRLNSDGVVFTPVLLFALGFGAWAVFRGGWSRERPVRFLLICVLLSCATIPLVVPNEGGTQWGPRFMLPLAAPICLLGVLLLDGLQDLKSARARMAGRVTFSLLALAGGALNSGLGVEVLARDYRERVLPALRLLRERPERMVVVSHQFVAQELEAAMADQGFLRCPTDADMRRLAPLLAASGAQRLLFILAAYDPEPVPRVLEWVGEGATVSGEVIDRFGDHYFLYECRVVTSW